MKKLYFLKIINLAAILIGIFACIVPIRMRDWFPVSIFTVSLIVTVGYLHFAKPKIEMSGAVEWTNLKYGLWAIAASLLIASIESHPLQIESASPFFICYWIGSILLLRQLRLLKYDDRAETARSALIDFGVVASLSLPLSIGQVRAGFMHTAELILSGLVYLFMAVINAVINILYRIQFFRSLFHMSFSSPKEKSSSIGNFGGGTAFNPDIQISNHGGLEFARNFWDGLFLVVLEILILWIATRILKRRRNHNANMEDYRETKEIMRDSMKITFKKRPIQFQAHRGDDLWIRRCYKKFMQLCIQNGIKIQKSDTTLQIQNKYAKKYDPRPAINLRKIYLLVRYHDEKPDLEKIKTFRESYNYIRKQIKHKR